METADTDEGMGVLRLTSDGTTTGSALYVDGRALDGVTRVAATLTPDELVSAVIYVEGMELDLRGDAKIKVVAEATPNLDALNAARADAWDEAAAEILCGPDCDMGADCTYMHASKLLRERNPYRRDA